MITRKVKCEPNEYITKCPKCSNNTEFTIHSDYCAEGFSELWAVCKCGFDPTNEDKGFYNRLEYVRGDDSDEISDENYQDAIIFAWNDTLELLDED